MIRIGAPFLFIFCLLCMACSKEDSQSNLLKCSQLDKSLLFIHSKHLLFGPEKRFEILKTSLQKFAEKYDFQYAPKTIDSTTDIARECKNALDAASSSKKKGNETPIDDFLFKLLSIYVQELDPYSRFLTKSEVSGEPLSWTGLSFGQGDGKHPVITKVEPGWPGGLADIQEGSTLLKVEGEDTASLESKKILHLLGSEVPDEFASGVNLTLGLKNSSIVREVNLKPKPGKKRRIRMPDDHYLFQVDKTQVGYLKLSRLSNPQSSDLDFFSQILNTYAYTTSTMILDLRGNPGVYVEVAKQIANQFTMSKKGAFAGFQFRDGRYDIEYFDSNSSVADQNLLVLVDRHTKSAAELLAAALQDYGAFIIGERTYGKGTSQVELSLPGVPFAHLLLSDSFTYRPSGEPIQEQGVKPDLEISSGKAISTWEGDPSLNGRSSEDREENLARHLSKPLPKDPLPGFDEIHPNRPGRGLVLSRIQLCYSSLKSSGAYKKRTPSIKSNPPTFTQLAEDPALKAALLISGNCL